MYGAGIVHLHNSSLITGHQTGMGIVHGDQFHASPFGILQAELPDGILGRESIGHALASFVE
jgi:hypothetical protein